MVIGIVVRWLKLGMFGPERPESRWSVEPPEGWVEELRKADTFFAEVDDPIAVNDSEDYVGLDMDSRHYYDDLFHLIVCYYILMHIIACYCVLLHIIQYY